MTDMYPDQFCSSCALPGCEFVLISPGPNKIAFTEYFCTRTCIRFSFNKLEGEEPNEEECDDEEEEDDEGSVDLNEESDEEEEDDDEEEEEEEEESADSEKLDEKKKKKREEHDHSNNNSKMMVDDEGENCDKEGEEAKNNKGRYVQRKNASHQAQ